MHARRGVEDTNDEHASSEDGAADKGAEAATHAVGVEKGGDGDEQHEDGREARGEEAGRGGGEAGLVEEDGSVLGGCQCLFGGGGEGSGRST